MVTVFILQWKRLFKRPTLLLTFFGLTLVFVYFLAGNQSDQTITVPTYSDDLSGQELSVWIDRLNEGEAYAFVQTERDEVTEAIRMNERSFALEINSSDFQFIIGREDMEISPIIRYVEQHFSNVKRLEQAEALITDDTIDVQEFIRVNTVAHSDINSSNNRYQMGIIMGMTLYFSVFSILFLMINLLEEKQSGTWQRLIFSPLTKTRIYLGQLFHYLLAGALQIFLALVVLGYIVELDLGTNYLSIGAVLLSFVFSIVSLGLMLMGVIKSVQQLQVIIPIVATSMAMLGGAFWPLEVVSNPVLLFLGDLMPITYGIEGMTGAVLLDQSLSQLMGPISILLLMGIIFMGVGLNLMERVPQP